MHLQGGSLGERLPFRTNVQVHGVLLRRKAIRSL
jgi:hypothetical protein